MRASTFRWARTKSAPSLSPTVVGRRPALDNGTIVDTLTGDLLDPTNTAVTASTCTATLPHLGSCTITTERAVQAETRTRCRTR